MAQYFLVNSNFTVITGSVLDMLFRSSVSGEVAKSTIIFRRLCTLLLWQSKDHALLLSIWFISGPTSLCSSHSSSKWNGRDPLLCWKSE